MDMSNEWELLRDDCFVLDTITILQEDAIDNVEMDDISQTNTCNDGYTATITQQSANANSKFSASDSNDSPSKSSRWEINESDTNNLDRLDGLNNLTTKNKKKALKQTDDGIDEIFISSNNDQKRVK
ncbi:hypothetical protein GJ496_004908 [Pomphorhynchus laevis]|nr:hypothetical protein GJ496_004908 [Pomphorhynchus laevis]